MKGMMKQLNFDRWGAFASSLCAVHCLLLGIVVGLFPAIGMSFLKNPLLEITFLLLAVGLGLAAVISGYQKHRSHKPTIYFAIGLTMLVVSFAMHHQPGHDHTHATASTGDAIIHIISMLGGLSLVYYHFLNQRLAKNCTCPMCLPAEATEPQS